MALEGHMMENTGSLLTPFSPPYIFTNKTYNSPLTRAHCNLRLHINSLFSEIGWLFSRLLPASPTNKPQSAEQCRILQYLKESVTDSLRRHMAAITWRLVPLKLCTGNKYEIFDLLFATGGHIELEENNVSILHNVVLSFLFVLSSSLQLNTIAVRTTALAKKIVSRSYEVLHPRFHINMLCTKKTNPEVASILPWISNCTITVTRNHSSHKMITWHGERGRWLRNRSTFSP